MSVCLPSLHWYALLPFTLSLTPLMIVFSLLFFLSLPLFSHLIMAFSVFLCSSLSCALPLFVVFPSLFLFPHSPTPPPSFRGCCCFCLLLLLRTKERQKRRIKRQARENKEKRAGSIFVFSPPEPSKHLCLLFTTKMAQTKTTGRKMLGGNKRKLLNSVPS